jgi:hypothetical protein
MGSAVVCICFHEGFPMRLFKEFAMFFMAISIVGCSTAPIAYTPKAGLTVKQARKQIEKLALTQHRSWKPDWIEIQKEYIAWGMGSVTTGGGIGTVIGDSVFSSGSSRTRQVGERLYFEDVTGIKINNWKTNRFVVRVTTKRGEQILLRTFLLEDAQSYVDSINVLLKTFGTNIKKTRMLKKKAVKTNKENEDTDW